ncbi:unnamed protein product [Schistosoma mattheei]|uniref:Uncharacterized protein n=1 Tax=Schistosoma mattheei TaxID=31246 RepID=A0A183P8G5_9TREM|nr:unnamed protein product [Schistosoma mattheei]
MTLPISLMSINHCDTTIITDGNTNNNHNINNDYNVNRKIMKSLSEYHINEHKQKFHHNLQTNFKEFTCLSQIIKQTYQSAHNSGYKKEVFTSNNDNMKFFQHENEQVIQSQQYNSIPRITIETMVLKLPTHIQREWLKVAYKIIKGGRKPLFPDLVEFVKEQTDIANTRYGLLVSRGSNSDNRDFGVLKGKISADYNAARISYASASDDNAPLRSSSCLECLSNHPLDQYQKFKDKNGNNNNTQLAVFEKGNQSLKVGGLNHQAISPLL